MGGVGAGTYTIIVVGGSETAGNSCYRPFPDGSMNRLKSCAWSARFGAMLQASFPHKRVHVVSHAAGGMTVTAALPLLPLPLAFNHMIVHAVVDGQDYWLDGTSAAARLANLADVPPFRWALSCSRTGLQEGRARPASRP